MSAASSKEMYNKRVKDPVTDQQSTTSMHIDGLKYTGQNPVRIRCYAH